MYQQLYEEVAQEASHRIRQDEQRAFRHSIGLMEKARKAGANSREAVEAIFFLNRLWGVLLEDLSRRDNELPDDLRAKLISIGIWILRYAEELRQGKKSDFLPIIEVSECISKGLGQNQ
ncbi:flagellar biosynthesis regulator FlaF [Aestuariivirga sp.]|uniref:flagellar biosynthesis regulator FlaF n=1 Tax=Aestuariivirga sp. TaxID=2650926 RepID=UPI0039E2E16F